MNKIFIIIEREYLTRIRKKSFIIMSIIGPLLMALVLVLPVWLSTVKTDTIKKIAVVDKTGAYNNTLKNNKAIEFEFIDNNVPIEELKKEIGKKGYYAVIEIPDWKDEKHKEVTFYSNKQAGHTEKSYISRQIENSLKEKKMTELGIDKEVVKSFSEKISIATKKMGESGKFEDSSTEASMMIGLLLGLVIYMFIFIYGAQVMRSIIDEKSSRVVELIVSSVKPFQMMMGKIVGVALVALTQFTIWIVLIAATLYFLRGMLNINPDDVNAMQAAASNNIPNKILFSVFNMPLFTMLITFVLYFIGGYLLYASLFAAIGSAVDSEADTQQFMLPVTIPLILSMMCVQIVMSDHDGSIGFWMSQIPLTSPIIMLIRIPFGDVPLWELLLSIAILFASFVGTTWMAAKIYRTGILMHGKKINYKELLKWLRYK